MGPWLKACRGYRRPCVTARRYRGPAPLAACSCWPRRSGTGGRHQEGSLEAVAEKGDQGEGAGGGMWDETNGRGRSKETWGPWKV